jgi:hypothetical protein
MSSTPVYEAPAMESVSPPPEHSTGPLDASAPLTVTARDIFEHLPFLKDPLAIYYTGSVALGWNHARSDLDIYVVTREPVDISHATGQHWSVDVDADPPTVEFVQGALGPYRAHVWFWLESQVNRVFERMPEQDLAAVYSLSNADWSFVYKLSIGRAMHGEEWLEAQQERLRRTNLSRALALWNVASAYQLLEDVEGFLISGDVHSAVLAAQEASRYTIDALLFETGDVTKLTKWRARRMRAANLEHLSFEEYWRLETMVGFDVNDPRPWVKATAHRSHDLLIGVAQRLDQSG